MPRLVLWAWAVSLFPPIRKEFFKSIKKKLFYGLSFLCRQRFELAMLFLCEIKINPFSFQETSFVLVHILI